MLDMLMKGFDKMITCIPRLIIILILLDEISMPTRLITLILILEATHMFSERIHILLAHMFRSHLQRCGWLRKIDFLSGLCLRVY
jgi:hypothetical protein